MSKLDEFMAEIKAFDYKWFCEIGGHEALVEIGRLREQAHAQQNMHPTYGESAPPMQWTTPEDFTAPVVRLVPPISG